MAQDLLGHRLVRILPDGTRLSGIFVEVEAYLGPGDASAHTFGGRRTPRVQAMYLGGGHWYVYFIYGNYFCINAVTGRPGDGEAVLLRALEPMEGAETMRENRLQRRKSKVRKSSLKFKDHELANGPGRLCDALGINATFNGSRIECNTPLFFEEVPNRTHTILSSPRIGLNPKSAAFHWPLRFHLEAHPCVSK